MVIGSPATPSWTIYAGHNYNQQSPPSKEQSHKKPSKYTINSIAKGNT